MLQPWQRAIVGNLFGWKRPDGHRRYREAFIYVRRKCGKSELAGGLGCLLTFADGEPVAQVYCAASDRDQARQELRTLKALSEQQYVPAVAFALIHAELGDYDAAFARMDEAFEARDGALGPAMK